MCDFNRKFFARKSCLWNSLYYTMMLYPQLVMSPQKTLRTLSITLCSLTLHKKETFENTNIFKDDVYSE